MANGSKSTSRVRSLFGPCHCAHRIGPNWLRKGRFRYLDDDHGPHIAVMINLPHIRVTCVPKGKIRMAIVRRDGRIKLAPDLSRRQWSDIGFDSTKAASACGTPQHRVAAYLLLGVGFRLGRRPEPVKWPMIDSIRASSTRHLMRRSATKSKRIADKTPGHIRFGSRLRNAARLPCRVFVGPVALPFRCLHFHGEPLMRICRNRGARAV
jgi:hypothetical protein